MSQHVLSNAVVQGIANSGSKNAGAAAALTNIGSQLFLKLPFSRDMEIEADSMGLELAARAGYDPRQAANIWRKFQSQQGTGSSVEFLNTHPGWERRVVESEAALAKVASLYQPPPEAESTNQSRSKMVTPTHQLAAPREPGISSPAAVDSGGHSGFAPTCRWVTATVWSCK